MQHYHQRADRSLIVFVILLQIIFGSVSDLKSWLKKIILQFFRFLSWFYVKHFHDFLDNFKTRIVMNFTWKFTIAMMAVKVLPGLMHWRWRCQMVCETTWSGLKVRNRRIFWHLFSTIQNFPRTDDHRMAAAAVAILWTTVL